MPGNPRGDGKTSNEEVFTTGCESQSTPIVYRAWSALVLLFGEEKSGLTRRG